MDWPAYLFACAALILTPGTGTLSVLAARARGGRRAGLLAIAGLACGDLILVIAVSAGLAGVLQQWPAAQHLLRWAGALYLLGLAATLWQAAPTTAASIKANQHAFGHSLLLTLLNPKAILFFAVFFPPFAPPGSGMLDPARPAVLPAQQPVATAITARRTSTMAWPALAAMVGRRLRTVGRTADRRLTPTHTAADFV